MKPAKVFFNDSARPFQVQSYNETDIFNWRKSVRNTKRKSDVSSALDHLEDRNNSFTLVVFFENED